MIEETSTRQQRRRFARAAFGHDTANMDPVEALITVAIFTGIIGSIVASISGAGLTGPEGALLALVPLILVAALIRSLWQKRRARRGY